MSSTLYHKVQEVGRVAKIAASSLAIASTEHKNLWLKELMLQIKDGQPAILKANAKDITAAEGQTSAFLDRLLLTPERINTIVNSLTAIFDLPDPIGRTLAQSERPNGLIVKRVSVPLGVVGMIYESRPNVTIDAAALSVKAGNAVILRPGSESFHSARIFVKLIQQALKAVGLPAMSVQLIPSSSRIAIKQLVQMDQWVDVIIPRGGKALLDYVSRYSRIPVFKHLSGLCHTYIHQDADKAMAARVVLNAKMRRPGICGATETILIDKAILHSHLSAIIEPLLEVGCEIRADEVCCSLDARLHRAVQADWDTEYLAPIVALKSVADLEEAILHIAMHGSQHTDAIITQNLAAATTFFERIDSAIVLHNASTQFADGGELGMGAEIGIATGKLHARGPVGLEQLTSFKYLIEGNGQIRVP